MTIKIKPQNVGKFSAKAKKNHRSVQAEASHVLRKGSKASAATKKQAVFAKNAAGWKKAKR